MKFEQNKHYRTRDGGKARVICTDRGGESPIVAIIGVDIFAFRSSGKWFDGEHHLDLMGEWVDEPVGSWDGYPAWMPWRMMDVIAKSQLHILDHQC